MPMASPCCRRARQVPSFGANSDDKRRDQTVQVAAIAEDVGEHEGEEQEVPDGTDNGAHREHPERAPARGPAPEVAAIVEDVGEPEERVPEVEDPRASQPLKVPETPTLRDKIAKT